MRPFHLLFISLFIVGGLPPQTSVSEIFPDSVKVPDHIPDSFLATMKDGKQVVVEGKRLYAHHYAAGWNRCREGYLGGRIDLRKPTLCDPNCNWLIRTYGHGIEGWQAGLVDCFEAMKAARPKTNLRRTFITVVIALVITVVLYRQVHQRLRLAR